MAILLVHETMDGEPIGIWNEAGESYYTPGSEDKKRRGQTTVEAKGFQIPWADFAERIASTTNFHAWWDTLDTEDPLPIALEHARDAFFTAQSTETQSDV